MKPSIDYTLYLVTDRNLMSTDTLEQAVEDACKGGVTIVQLREKNISNVEYAAIGRSIKSICDTYSVPLIINDNPEVAVAVDAAGVHIGQEDLEASSVRNIIGDDVILGVSVHSVDEVRAAEAAGADYLGVGAIAFTTTKPEADVLTLDEIQAIIDAANIPVVVIGGVNEATIPMLKDVEPAGYSLVSAIITADDIEAATRNLRRLIEKN